MTQSFFAHPLRRDFLENVVPQKGNFRSFLLAALKVIKLGMDTAQVIARFEAERQALALMDHPHIAKAFDAGATEAGRPFFVMELARGIRITDYCDLKPSNILVTLDDGAPVPKVIDFGIAKATAGPQLTDKTLFTAFGQFDWPREHTVAHQS